MNSNQGYLKLLSIKQELANYHNNREEVMKQAIQQRLNKSLNNYYDSLVKSLSYLSKKDANKLIKKV